MPRSKDLAVQLAVSLLLLRSAAAQNNNNNNAGTTTNGGNNNQPTTTAANQPNSNTAQGTNTANLGSSALQITGIPPTGTASVSNAGSSVGLTDLPTINGYGIPTMIVPNTQNAPYMQRSSLPEGTVFIVVGAFLAFLGVAILAWRGIVAWSIHRSVKRANEKFYQQPESVKLVKPGYGGAASLASMPSMSHDALSGSQGNTLAKKTNFTPTRSNIASSTAATRNSSLFFSPTAGGGHPNTSSTFLPHNRSSSFLPSGYYAAPGAASPAQGATTTQIGSGSANRYSRYSRYRDDVTPPGSPGLPPSSRGLDSRGGSHGMYHQPSTSSLNLNIPGTAHSGGRAPSANLDDMLGDYPLPSAR